MAFVITGARRHCKLAGEANLSVQQCDKTRVGGGVWRFWGELAFDRGTGLTEKTRSTLASHCFDLIKGRHDPAFELSNQRRFPDECSAVGGASSSKQGFLAVPTDSGAPSPAQKPRVYAATLGNEPRDFRAAVFCRPPGKENECFSGFHFGAGPQLRGGHG